jgi:hypothetical protein
MSVRVYDLAHSRAGDKGNTSNISVICYDAKHWEFLERELTVERVADAFAHIAKGPLGDTALSPAQSQGVQFRDRECAGRWCHDFAGAGHSRQELQQCDAGDHVAGSEVTAFKELIG